MASLCFSVKPNRLRSRVSASGVSAEEQVQVLSADGESREKVPQRLVCEVVQARLEEILEMVYADVKRAGAGDLCAGGVVISGGGSQLPDTARLASAVMGDMSVRVGKPRGLSGLVKNVSSPVHATGVGLATQAARDGVTTHRPPGPTTTWARVTSWAQWLWQKAFPHSAR